MVDPESGVVGSDSGSAFSFLFFEDVVVLVVVVGLRAVMMGMMRRCGKEWLLDRESVVWFCHDSCI